MALLRRTPTTATAAGPAAAEGRPVGRRRRIIGGGAAVAGTLLGAIARIVALATLIAVGLIAAAILLRVLDANARNAIVKDVHDAGNWLVGPFGTMFSIRDAKESIAVNWGIPAVIYLIVGSMIVRWLRRAALGASAARA